MNFKIKLLFAILLFVSQSIFAQSNEQKSVIIDKVKIAYRVRNLESRKTNEPIIVFESGLGGGTFEPTYTYISKNASYFEYDRNGVGESDLDTTIKTDVQVIERLHKVLISLNINPPYLLVGHSFGGPLIRLYASRFPNDVCGLILIDPTDFMLTKKENEQAKKASSSLTGYREIWKISVKGMANDTSLPIGIRQEASRLLVANTPDLFKEYQNLLPIRDIPITVIISYNKPIVPYEEEMNKRLKLGINTIPWWREFDDLRIKHYGNLIRNNHDSKVLLLPGYSHFIHYQDPELVGKSISEVYNKCLLAEKK